MVGLRRWILPALLLVPTLALAQQPAPPAGEPLSLEEVTREYRLLLMQYRGLSAQTREALKEQDAVQTQLRARIADLEQQVTAAKDAKNGSAAQPPPPAQAPAPGAAP
jgi:hypothetical protein